MNTILNCNRKQEKVKNKLGMLVVIFGDLAILIYKLDRTKKLAQIGSLLLETFFSKFELKDQIL